MDKNKKIILMVIIADILAVAIIAAAVVVIYMKAVKPFFEFVSEKEQSESESDYQEYPDTEEKEGQNLQLDSNPENDNVDSAEKENANWAEDFYKAVIFRTDDDMVFNNVLNTDVIKNLYNSHGERYVDDMFSFNAIMWHYEELMGFEHNDLDYWGIAQLNELNYLSQNDKTVLQGFLLDDFSYIDEFSAAEVQSALDYFYGKGNYTVEGLSNGKNFYLSEDGNYFYLRGCDGIGSLDFMLFMKLVEVEYEGNEAVLSLKILLDYGQDVPYYPIYDYVSGYGIMKTNKLRPWDLDPETALETLCSENEVEYDDLETARLRIGKNENGIYIIGWEGIVPGNMKW